MTNKRFVSIVVTIFLLFAGVFVSAGCDSSSTADNHIPNPTPMPKDRFTVTFDSNGGTNVPSQIVESGGTLTMPDNPTKDGYVFAGWFKDKEFKQSFAFGENGDKITADITLYARWVTVEALQADYAVNEIVIGYAEGDNPKYVTQNLTLPTKINSTDISWSSSSRAVASDGTVTRQAEDTDVTLTATASYNGESSDPRTFTVKVIRKRTRDNSTIKARTIDEASSGDISIQRNESGDVTDIEGQYVSFDIRNADDALDAVTVIRDELGIRSPDQELKTYLATSNSYGAEYSFQQVYKGVKVYGRSLMASVNASGKGDFLHSSILASSVLDNADMKVNLTVAQAENIAEGIYSRNIKAKTDSTELVVYSLESHDNAPVYAYIVNLSDAKDGMKHFPENVIVNAETGAIIKRFQDVFHATPQTVWILGTGELDDDILFPTTEYTTDNQTNLLMLDTTGFTPLVMVHDNTTNHSVVQHLLGEAWTDRQQISAYNNIRELVQWWQASFDRDSLNGEGGPVRIVTHSTIEEDWCDNAAWSNEYKALFIWDKEDYDVSCAAGVDILAHETTHAVMNYTIGFDTSQLLSRAIKEGYADIFGAISEKNWLIGERVYISGDYVCLRNIRFPNVSAKDKGPSKVSEIPAYKDDDGHLNSLVVSHTAYLMHQDNLPGKGLTWDELAQVWYKSMSMGISAFADFQDIRRCVIWSAMKIDLSAEKLAVIKAAFDEVGITEAKSKGTVYGIVRDKTDPNKLLEGVRVTASEKKLQNGRIKTAVAGKTTTTAAGGYFIQLEAGKYTLSFDKTGYLSGSADVVIQSNDSVSINKELPLAEVSLSGIIRDISDGSQIAGATVSLRKGWGGYASENLKTTTTDANGLYYFDLTQEGTGLYTVDVLKQGYKSASLEVAVGGNTAGQDLALEPVSTDIPVVVSGDIPIDAAHFHDENFREYVKALDTNNNQTLSREEIALVERINVSNKNISSLKGIEYFTALKFLDCSYNRLTEIDISKNILLEQLLCSNNQLTEINLTANIMLKRLSCINNMLKRLDVSNNTALINLDCGSEVGSGYDTQEIITLDLSKNTSLYSLTCRKAGLSSLILGRNSVLEYIDCQYNDIKVLNLSGCPKLGRNNVFCENSVTVIWPSSATSATYVPSASQSGSSPAKDSFHEILAILPAFTPSATGIYSFTVQLNSTPPEGSQLVLLAASEDLDASFTFTDSSDVVRVSADFIAGRLYAPVIAAIHKDESQSGGCNVGTWSIMIFLAGICFMKK